MSRSMQERLRQEAHLWLQPLAEGSVAPSLETLSAQERQRADEIRHPRTRHHYIAGRNLVRRALSCYVDVEPCDWRFEVTEDGRPEIAAPTLASALRFNLSHTDGLAVCLITDTVDCGVDAEHIGRTVDELGIAAHSFSREELAELEDLSPSARRVRFAELWTLKEAFLKALGSGIRLRLDAITFSPIADRLIRYHLGKKTPERDVPWHFALFRRRPDHLLAAAVRWNRPTEPSFSCWQLNGRSTALQLRMVAFASTPADQGVPSGEPSDPTRP